MWKTRFELDAQYGPSAAAQRFVDDLCAKSKSRKHPVVPKNPDARQWLVPVKLEMGVTSEHKESEAVSAGGSVGSRLRKMVLGEAMDAWRGEFSCKDLMGDQGRHQGKKVPVVDQGAPDELQEFKKKNKGCDAYLLFGQPKVFAFGADGGRCRLLLVDLEAQGRGEQAGEVGE